MTDLSLPDHEYLTVKELADLLRLKERKVYDLAASGAVPCSRATGKLLFPADEIRAWIDGARTGAAAPAPATPRPPIVLGSHDPLLDWAMRTSRCGLASYYDGSLDGLDRFAQGKGVAAGLHIHDAASDSWNVAAVSGRMAGMNAVLIAFASRWRGLVFRPDETAPKGLDDLHGRRIVPRQPESGTDGLFRELLEKQGVPLAGLRFTDMARTEDEAVEAVRHGAADTAFGLEAAARNHGLGFLPIVQEQFALLIDRKAYFDPSLQTLLRFCQGPHFAKRAQANGGYDIGQIGTVLWNG